MSFLKGVVWGTAISLGAMIIYNETSKDGMKMNKMMKKGKKMIKTMGMM